jgi:MFS family permease
VVPLAFVSSLPALAAALFVSGCAISPTLVAAFTHIEETVPSSRLTEGISVFTTALGVGLAPGAAAAGWAVEHGGPTPASGCLSSRVSPEQWWWSPSPLAAVATDDPAAPYAPDAPADVLRGRPVDG